MQRLLNDMCYVEIIDYVTGRVIDNFRGRFYIKPFDDLIHNNVRYIVCDVDHILGNSTEGIECKEYILRIYVKERVI
ncbi:MAG: hypothetical protein H0Z24_05545 [Thermosipho sp. (in: Bacteria)]|nr:hypothetical protein [Thermosipho sp. (in: thermotogales)]